MNDLAHFALGLIWYPVFLFSTVLHEAAHAFVARLGGDQTAYASGQLTLDPLPHIKREPFGMVLVPVLSYALGGWMFGWASVPLDPAWAERYPHRAGWMALAGPTANLLLVLVAASAVQLGLATGVFAEGTTYWYPEIVRATSPSVEVFAMFFSILFSLNFILFVFNLLPVPPLDGSSVINLLLPEDQARRLQAALATPALSLVGLLIAWNLFPRFFGPLYRVAVDLLY